MLASYFYGSNRIQIFLKTMLFQLFTIFTHFIHGFNVLKFHLNILMEAAFLKKKKKKIIPILFSFRTHEGKLFFIFTYISLSYWFMCTFLLLIVIYQYDSKNIHYQFDSMPLVMNSRPSPMDHIRSFGAMINHKL